LKKQSRRNNRDITAAAPKRAMTQQARGIGNKQNKHHRDALQAVAATSTDTVHKQGPHDCTPLTARPATSSPMERLQLIDEHSVGRLNTNVAKTCAC
jgi:nitrate reductase alpha subunit